MLSDFILRAKSATYVGAGAAAEPSVPGAHDLVYAEGDLTYRDSFFGGTDFLGREVVWQAGRPVWVMHYYGRILRDDLIHAGEAGQVIRAALTDLYNQGRFLGGHQFQAESFVYLDESQGDWQSFTGQERILRGGVLTYVLDYHGGLVRD